MAEERFIGWWSIGEKENTSECIEYPGELRITDSEEYVLNIYGLPKELNTNLNRINEQELIPVIIGFAKSQDNIRDYEFTLINSEIITYKSSSLDQVGVRPKAVIKGLQAKNGELPKFGQIAIRPMFMEEWLSVSGFKRTKKVSEVFDKGKFSTGVSYDLPKKITLVKNSKLNVCIDFSASGPGFPIVREASIKERAYLIISFRFKKKIADLIKYILSIQEFFSFVIGLPVKLEEIKVREYSFATQKRKKLEHKPFSIFYLRHNQKFTSRKSVRSNSTLLPFKYIEENCPNLLEQWLLKYDRLLPAHRLYFGKIFSKNQYDENAFLDIVFSIEVLHRLVYEDFDGKHEKYYSKLDKIVGKLSLNDKNWIMARLGNKSGKTLLNRFEHIHEEFKSVFRLIFSKPNKAIKKIVTTRNYLVHYEINESLKNKVIESSKLYLFTNRLTVIYQTMLLYYLTGDKTLVQERIDKATLNKVYIRYKYE